MSKKKSDTDRPAAEMPLSFGAEAPSDWLGKNIAFRVGKGGEGYIRDKSTGEWKPVDAMSDDLIKELRSYPRHYETAHKAADALEKANRHTHAREYYNIMLEDQLIKTEMENERLREGVKVQANAVKMLDRCRDTEVARLRETHRQAELAAKTLDSEREANALLTAENERLRAENARLHQVLERIKSMKPEPIGGGFQHGPLLLFQNCQNIARAALEEEKK